MEQNLSSFSSPRTGKPAPKRRSRLKLALIIAGSIIGLLILAVIIIIVYNKYFVIPKYQSAADADYIIDSKQAGAKNYYRKVEINGKKARLSLCVPESVRYGITFVLRPYEPVTVDGIEYQISVDLDLGFFPWEVKYFFGWSAHNYSKGVELDSSGEPINTEYDWMTDSDLQLIREMKQYYKPLLDHIKAERERIEDNYG